MLCSDGNRPKSENRKGLAMGFRKIAALLAATALALGALLAATGCGANAEEAIRNAIIEELDTYKNMDDSVLSATSEVLAGQGLEEMGIDSEGLAVTILDGFDYSVDDVTVEGDKAVATVTIVSKSYSDFEAAVDAAIAEVTADPAVADMSQEEIYQLYGQRIMEAIDGLQAKPETTEVEYAREGNAWEPVNGEKSLSHLDSLVFAE